MPRLLGRLLVSDRAKQRARLISLVAFAAVALISWWAIIDEGPTRARVIGAIAATFAVLIESLWPQRPRLLRRQRSAPGPN